MGALKKVIAELHRRSLWQVLGIYIAGAIGALEIVDMLVENAGLPGWFPALALALIILGLPVVLATAFIQEGGPGSDNDLQEPGDAAARVAGDSGVPPAPSASLTREEGAPGIFTWRNAAVGGAAAVLLWAGIAVGWVMFGREASAANDQAATAVAAAPSLDRSIAVLPFATRSAAEEDRYFAEGMHDDLLTQLSKIEGLTVISRTSVMQYAETTSSIPEIAAELGVSTILEGAVQRSGERIRVNMQLIEAETDRHLWAETYDEELSAANVFAIQSDLAHKIAAALQATLNPAVAERLDARPTESLEAYDLVARGRYVFTTDGRLGLRLDEVTDYFQRAIALDSSYAAAWAGLADSYLMTASVPNDAITAKADAAVQRALALDDNLAEAHLAHSRLLSFNGQPEQALAAAQRAHTLEPGSAEVQRRLGSVLEQLGKHDEAVAAARRAVELDPRATRNRNTLADRLYFAGEFDESIQHSRRVVEMDPDDWYAYYNLGWAYAAAGRPQEALAAFRHMPETSENWIASKNDGIAYAFALAGQRDSSLAALAHGSDNSHDRVLVYYVLGDTDTALDELRRLLRERPDLIGPMVNDPAAKEMLADPRFAAVIEQAARGN